MRPVSAAALSALIALALFFFALIGYEVNALAVKITELVKADECRVERNLARIAGKPLSPKCAFKKTE